MAGPERRGTKQRSEEETEDKEARSRRTMAGRSGLADVSHTICVRV